MYVIIVKKPIDESFDISFKSEIPLIKEAKISGIAINLRELMKIVPKGLIQLVIIILPPLIELKINPKKTPRNIPIIIFQCNEIFFIIFLNC